MELSFYPREQVSAPGSRLALWKEPGHPTGEEGAGTVLGPFICRESQQAPRGHCHPSDRGSIPTRGDRWHLARARGPVPSHLPHAPALGGGSAAPEVTGTCPGASPGAGRILCSRKPARGWVPCSKWPQLAGARGSSRLGAWPCAPSCPHPSQPGRACPWPACPCGGHTRGAGTAPPPAAGQPS